MSQVTNLVADSLRDTQPGPVCLIATDRLDTPANPLLRLIHLARLWYCTLRVLPRADCVYSTLSASWPGVVKNVLVLAPVLLARKKLILHSHSGGFRRFYLDRVRWQRLFIRAFVGRSSVVLVVHDRYRKHFRSCKTHVEVLLNASDDLGVVWKPPATVRQPVRLLFFSNLMREKGLPALLEATRLLAERGIETELRVAGAAIDVDPGEMLTAASQRIGIDFRGTASGVAEKRQLFEDIDMLVLPTRYRNEALPLVVLESLSTATPVLCTPFRALREVIEPGVTGWHCDGSANAIVGAILHYSTLATNEREKIRRNCRGEWERNYTRERFDARLAEIVSTEH